MAKKSAAAIKRLPAHRAPFYFAPAFLQSADEWKANFSDLLATLVHDRKPPAEICELHGPWSITIRLERTDFTVDARNGTFMLDERSDQDDQDNWTGPLDAPRAFCATLATVTAPKELLAEVRFVSNLALKLVDQMDARLQQALREGRARYEARFGSIAKQFRPIEADQLQLIQFVDFDRNLEGHLEDDRLDEATGPRGERIFSLCVVPVERNQVTTQPSLRETSVDHRRRYDPRKYEPVIERHTKEVKRKFGKGATQAEVKRRSIEEFEQAGWKVPSDTTLDDWVSKMFKDK